MSETSDPKPWHLDERFWSTMRDGIFEPRRWAQAETEVEQLLKLLKLPAHASVLDMPCGPGRHLVHLAAHELRVTGVDLTQSYLDEASERLRAAGLTAELVHANMLDLVRPAGFDAVLHLYSSFGYFDDPRDDLRLLRNMRASLRPGGYLVLEMLVRDGGAVTDVAHEHDLGDGARLAESESWLEADGVIKRNWDVHTPEAHLHWQAKHRLYWVRELEQMLRDAGFSTIHSYGGFDARPLSESEGNALLIANTRSVFE